MSAQRIWAVTVTPVAFADPPLLNSVGVHEPFALRAVVEVSTDGGLSGLGETYADDGHLAALYAAADASAEARVPRKCATRAPEISQCSSFPRARVGYPLSAATM